MAKAADLVFANPQLVDTYIKFRPAPPPALINTVVQWVREGRHKAGGEGCVAGVCVDLGCGSGQNTALLVPHFTSVVGVDVSEPQLDMASRAHKDLANLSFRVGSAESLPFDAGSVDLVTCCAAVHWFDFDTFYKEVDRVLLPGGVLACYGYTGCSPLCNGHNLRRTFEELWHELDCYWPKGHGYLWGEYATLPQLYPADKHIGSSDGAFSMTMEGTVQDVMGYMASWSAFHKLQQNEGERAAAEYLAMAKRRLLEAAGTDDDTVPMTRHYDYYLRMWQKPLPC